MSRHKDESPRGRLQHRVSKVVWGLFFIGMGALFTLQNLGRVELVRSPFPAGNAVDGNPQTRWSSSFSQPQWITVDLGSTSDINRIKLSWEAAYAKQYELAVSDDGFIWTTVQNVIDGHGNTEDFTVSTRGRYVRMLGTKRATGWGISLWELEVYGPEGLLSQGRKAAASALEGGNYWLLLWPLCLVAAGIPPLLVPRDSGNQVVGLVMVGVGGFFALQNFGLVTVSFTSVWPVLLIVAGGMLVLQSMRSESAAPPNVDGPENAGGPQ